MSEALPLVERHERIVAYLAGHGSATVEELSAAFAVSAVTIRSDLRSLQRQLRVRRARGHAIAIEPPSGGAPRGADDGLRALGEAGAQLVTPGDVVHLDASPGAVAVAESLAHGRTPWGDDAAVTVCTNALAVVAALRGAAGVRVVAVGGTLHESSGAFVEPLLGHAFGYLTADLAFFGCEGLDPDGGVTTGHHAVADVTRRSLANARRRVLLAPADVLGHRAAVPVCDLRGVDLILAVAPGPAGAALLTEIARTGPAVRTVR
ncbi:DeoR/GlpR family DNA-binding transcription regulator [Luedemannella flava]|uniref:DeoR/GlpR family DNA-binding transcription regulator n=1 Tax=Luedemannella flava TaxID=349316 RepID=A0ABN2M6V9_9ACTN